MKNTIARARRALDSLSAFSDWGSIQAYRGLLYRPERSPDILSLGIRPLSGRRVLCRKGTADVETLWDTFVGRYHLPLRKLVKPSLIIDLGANVGYTALDFAACYPSAHILAVEMDSGNCELFRRNTAHLGNRVTLVHGAIWSVDGVVAYGGRDVNGYRISRGNVEPGARTTDVEAITIETLLARFGQRHAVDYLKMDIEGAEHEVLADAPAWLSRVRQISVEIHPPATDESCMLRLTGRGFRCSKSRHHHNAVFGLRG